MRVKKRNGELVEFDITKIEAVIRKVGLYEIEIVKEVEERVVYTVNTSVVTEDIVNIEDIQDIISEVLMERGHFKEAQAFILYRQKHKEQREIANMFNTALVDSYIDKEDWEVKENANMNYSLQGLNQHIGGKLMKNYWLDSVYTPEIKEAHNSGDLHIHDLGHLSVYCVGWDLYDLLMKGFGGVAGKVESAPPKHFKTAMNQIVNFFYTLTGEAAGAQAFSNFDTLLAPFISYDNLTRGDVKQTIQEFLFNMNVPTRMGCQCPFTNITLDYNVPKHFKDQPVLIGGKLKSTTYKDFQQEMNMFNSVFFEVMAQGDAKGRIFAFPIPTVNITKDFEWSNPVYDNLWKITAKYGTPYFSNFINSDMSPEDSRSMCPIDGNEFVLVKNKNRRDASLMKIKDVYYGKCSEHIIYSDGKFVEGNFNKYENQDMYKLSLVNGHNITLSKYHQNIVLRENEIITVDTDSLIVGDYLPYAIESYKEGVGGNYDVGYIVGAYAGDGSYGGDGAVVFSLSENKLDTIDNLIRIVKDLFGDVYTLTTYADEKIITLYVSSKACVGLCRDFVEGKGRDKYYKGRVYTMSDTFKDGLFQGHFDTDGGNRNRIYTSSEKMVTCLNMLCATMGTTTSIYVDDRPGRLSEHPNYAVLIYKLNRSKYADFWIKKDNKLWVRVCDKVFDGTRTAYCFEVTSGEPIFTVGSTGILTHNCRLRLDSSQIHKRGGGLFGANPLTGSVGVVTINLPRIGYMASNTSAFLEILQKHMGIAKDSLEQKRKMIEVYADKGLYPYTSVYLNSVKEKTGKYWVNHFSTIGLVGMNETCLNMLGVDLTSDKGQEFAEKVLDFMRDTLKEFQEETGNLYNLEATPAEGTSYRLALKDKNQKKCEYFANVSADDESGITPFYTNSSQLPVDYEGDIFDILDKQDNIQSKYTGGTVQHLFIGEEVDGSYKPMINMIKAICENYKLPYFTLSPVFSVCPEHGYIFGNVPVCVKCGKETEVYARIVGYYRPVKQWNDGKRAEFDMRKVLKIEK